MRPNGQLRLYSLRPERFQELDEWPSLSSCSTSISFLINCETSQDVPLLKQTHRGRPSRTVRLAEGKVRALLAGGAHRVGEVLGDKDPARAKRAMEAMLKMSKIDVNAIKLAASG